jgi:hypothetical protein
LEEPKQLDSLAPFTFNASVCTKEPIDIERKLIISSITRTFKNEKKKIGYKKLH